MMTEAERLKALQGSWLEKTHRIDFKKTAAMGLYYTGNG